MTSKPRLHRDVAEALEKAEQEEEDTEYIAWVITDADWVNSQENDCWKVLHNYASEEGNFFKIIDALRHGYIIDDHITLTISQEQIDKIRALYQQETTNPFEQRFFTSTVIKVLLDILNFKIPGVTAE